MIYSVVNLPRTSNPKRLKFTLNATSFFDFQRTFHGVALLCLSRNDDMVKNAEALIHMWYSSRLTDDINDHVISRLADITRQRRSGQGSFLRTTDSLSECVVMEWKLPNVQLSLALQEKQKLTFDRTVNPSSDLNRLTRLEEFCFQKDDRQRDVKSFFTSAARMPRSRALGLLQWRVDGLLLPFDHPKSEFYIPNSYVPIPDFLILAISLTFWLPLFCYSLPSIPSIQSLSSQLLLTSFLHLFFLLIVPFSISLRFLTPRLWNSSHEVFTWSFVQSGQTSP